MNYRTTAMSRLMGIALVAGIAGAANAQIFTDADTLFIGVTGSSIQYSTNSGGSYSGDQGAGFMRWRPNNAVATANLTNFGGRTDGDFNAICGELVGLGNPQLVDGYLSSVFAGADAANVKRAGALVGDNYNNSGVNSFFHALGTGDNVVYSAFQASVWAARYGGGSALVDGGSTLQVGTFWIRDGGGVGGGNWGAFKTAFSGYYNSAYNHGFNGASLYLDAHPLGSTQDQFTVEGRTPPVPEPFTMVLGAASLAVAARRRLAKRA